MGVKLELNYEKPGSKIVSGGDDCVRPNPEVGQHAFKTVEEFKYLDRYLHTKTVNLPKLKRESNPEINVSTDLISS